MSDMEKFECWAIVEVMGHQRYAGHVSEQAIGGCAFVRVDVPAVLDRPAFTKLLGQGSIFCITPVSKEAAVTAAASSVSRPVEVYSPTLHPQLRYDGDEDNY